MINKICKKCGGSHIKKDWIKRWKQRYKCCLCWYVFQNNSRYRINKWLWEDYTEHKQTYKELWEKYWKDKRTIRKELDKIILKKRRNKTSANCINYRYNIFLKIVLNNGV